MENRKPEWLKELEALRRFKSSVIGWEDRDQNEGFCSGTAEDIVDQAKAAESGEDDAAS